MRGKTAVIVILALLVSVGGGFALGSWYLRQDSTAAHRTGPETPTPAQGNTAPSVDTVRVIRLAPEGEKAELPRIEVTFDAKPKDTAAVEAGFSLLPALPGTFTWQDQTLIFTPSSAFRPGALYTVRLESSSVIPGIDGRWVDGKATSWSFVAGGAASGRLTGVEFYGAGYQLVSVGMDGEAQVLGPWPSDKSLDDAVWSPSGGSLLFQSGFLFTFGLDNRQVTQVIGLEQGEPEPYHAAWSPDGRSVVFQSGGKIYTLSLSRGAAPKPLRGSFTGPVYPVWSPAGGSVAVFADKANGRELWLTPSGGSGETKLLAKNVAAFKAFAWAPDGKTIAYITGGGDASDLHIYDVATAKDQLLAKVSAGQLWWSPDGARLAILSGDELWVVGVGGQGLTPVARGIQAGQSTVTWSPTGAYLAYIDKNGHLWQVRADGEGARQLTSGQEKWMLPRWSAH